MFPPIKHTIVLKTQCSLSQSPVYFSGASLGDCTGVSYVSLMLIFSLLCLQILQLEWIGSYACTVLPAIVLLSGPHRKNH